MIGAIKVNVFLMTAPQINVDVSNFPFYTFMPRGFGLRFMLIAMTYSEYAKRKKIARQRKVIFV